MHSKGEMIEAIRDANPFIELGPAQCAAILDAVSPMIAANEREECAKEVARISALGYDQAAFLVGRDIAEAIRARSDSTPAALNQTAAPRKGVMPDPITGQGDARGPRTTKPYRSFRDLGAVAQFRRVGCADWYDGHPDHSDGGGPYETRVLYAAPTQSPPPVSQSPEAATGAVVGGEMEELSVRMKRFAMNARRDAAESGEDLAFYFEALEEFADEVAAYEYAKWLAVQQETDSFDLLVADALAVRP